MTARLIDDSGLKPQLDLTCTVFKVGLIFLKSLVRVASSDYAAQSATLEKTNLKFLIGTPRFEPGTAG